MLLRSSEIKPSCIDLYLNSNQTNCDLASLLILFDPTTISLSNPNIVFRFVASPPTEPQNKPRNQHIRCSSNSAIVAHSSSSSTCAPLARLPDSFHHCFPSKRRFDCDSRISPHCSSCPGTAQGKPFSTCARTELRYSSVSQWLTWFNRWVVNPVEPSPDAVQ